MSSIIVEPLVSVEFEVYGHVQGVYFTKYCKEYSEQLGLRGWVKNSKKGTIVGKIQGNKTNVDTIDVGLNNGVQIIMYISGHRPGHMYSWVISHRRVQWLSHRGSPGCKIERCELTNFQNLARPDFPDFSIRF